MGEYRRLMHEFPPVYDADSRILILGSFPSVKSREQGFYYGHPRNRFWSVLAEVTGEMGFLEAGESTGSKKSLDAGGAGGGSISPLAGHRRKLLLAAGIALWDVVEECEIIGSKDSSIRNVVPTRIDRILETARIQAIYTNGTTAYRLYRKYQQPVCGREAVLLPSTSPANAAWSVERLVEAWSCIRTE